MAYLPLSLLSLFLLWTLTTSRTPFPSHLFKSTLYSQQNPYPKYFEVTLPVPRDHRPPSCSLLLFQHNFSNTVRSPPFKTTYCPPSDCPPPWSAVYVEISASYNGKQHDRIAAVWIDGVEILRTSTPEPTDAGASWNVRKDITRYVSALKQSQSTVAMVLENAIDDVFTGIYSVNLSLNFYNASEVGVSSEEERGDLKSDETLGFLGGEMVELGFFGEKSVELGFLGGEKVSEKGKKGILGKESSSGDGEIGLLSREPLDQAKLGFLGGETVGEKIAKGVGKKSSSGVGELELLPEEPLEEGKLASFAGEGGEKVRKLGFLSEENVEEKGVLGFLSEGNAGIVVDEVEKLRLGVPSKDSSHLIGQKEKLGSPLRELPVVANGQDEIVQLQQEKCAEIGSQDIWRSLYNEPADLVIPISDDGENGLWFRIQNETDIHSKEIEIPANTHRAVLEIYASSHGHDEFWYSKPPTSYTQQNNLTMGWGNGTFQEVFAMIDGLYVGSVVPFPVVYSGRINPLFWEPVVAIGAFDLPSYELDLTPFLGLLLDGNPHNFGLGVTDGNPFWLVDANLHLWLDDCSSKVEAKLVKYHAPKLSIKRESKIRALDRKFKIEGERKVKFSGWVKSSAGNLTTHVEHELELKSKMKFKANGIFNEFKRKIETETEVKVEAYSALVFARSTYKKKYPLSIKTSTVPQGNNTYLSKISLTLERNEKSSVVLPSGIYSSSLENSQESEGWMLVQDHSVLSSGASTEHDYRYKDDKGCYSRTVTAKDGEVVKDNMTEVCSVPLLYSFLQHLY